MPQRNAVGEAFKNNGYRMPGGADEAFTKQENIKIGTDEWKKAGVYAPNTGSYPQFDPLSVVLTGNIVSWKGETKTAAGAISAKQELTIAATNTASLFFGGTIGNSISVFGELAGFGGATVESDADASTTGSVDTQVTSNVRAVYQISPGFNFALGNSFSAVGWNGTGAGGVVNVGSVLPAPGTYAELNFTKGETGGYSIVAGTSIAAKTTTPIVATDNNINDITYLRAKVKLFGAGLLSGTGGELGNSYNGVDNQLTIGAGFSHAKNKTGVKNTSTGITPTLGFTGNYSGETWVYGADVQGAYNDFLVGVAASKDSDLKLNNLQAEAGYFIYPWLYAKVGYVDIANASKLSTAYDIHQPRVVPAVSAWIAPNISLTGTYTIYTKKRTTDPVTGVTNQNTFVVAVRAGF